MQSRSAVLPWEINAARKEVRAMSSDGREDQWIFGLNDSGDKLNILTSMTAAGVGIAAISIAVVSMHTSRP